MIQRVELLQQLVPWLRGYVRDVVLALNAINYSARIVSVYRSPAEQNARFRAGESSATGGNSPHNHGLAFDIVVPQGENSPEQLELQQFWKALGFNVIEAKIGNPPRHDWAHVEMPNWRAFVK